jgi:hypothetical protein
MAERAGCANNSVQEIATADKIRFGIKLIITPYILFIKFIGATCTFLLLKIPISASPFVLIVCVTDL